MDKKFLTLVIAIAIAAGSITTGTMAFAAPGDQGKPFEALQAAITDLQTQISSIPIGDSDWTIVGNNMFSAVSGNVGIGTTTPDSALHVTGSGSAGAPTKDGVQIVGGDVFGNSAIELTTSGGNPYIDFQNDITGTDFDMRLILRGDDALLITGGNVGIGTDPTARLQVLGPTPAIKFGDGNGFGGLHAGSDRVFLATQDGTESLVIKQSTKRVGIGTSDPNRALHVVDVAGGGVTVQTSGAGPAVLELRTAAGPNFIFTDSSGNLQLRTDSASEDVILQTGGAQGNVGIGTINPNSKLEVNGYIELDTSSGTPPSADCDNADEVGRMKVDVSNTNLYICTSSGWVTK